MVMLIAGFLCLRRGGGARARCGLDDREVDRLGVRFHFVEHLIEVGLALVHLWGAAVVVVGG